MDEEGIEDQKEITETKVLWDRLETAASKASWDVIHVKIMENVLQMRLDILVVTVAPGGQEKLAIQT